MDLGIPPLKHKIMLESNPLRSRIQNLSTEIGPVPGDVQLLSWMIPEIAGVRPGGNDTCSRQPPCAPIYLYYITYN